ncbi:MAG TPA: IS1 family transposase [Flavobacterium sp.]|uniref:IS1 family transposase n=1 Tax=unclassified Flavobacterium TaxID=196869 RepID=UPI0025BD91B6|nr:MULTISPECIES: IS1 family transposase [unclassified Flavobacterium]HRE77741.1 IS1 family transposase [Flavobacterium sp.]
MKKSDTTCFKISDIGICPHCKSNQIIKNGFTKNRKQQFYCKSCKTRSIDFYSNNAYCKYINSSIIRLTKEGVGIRSTARILNISPTTVLRRIILIAKAIKSPSISMGKIYEVDEMRSFISNKSRPIWIVYALQRKTKKVVSFAIGKRTLRTLGTVINTLQLSKPKRIYTDGLRHYKSLTEKTIHCVKRYGTNQIERNNLTLRNNLKRLNRKTICYSKSYSVLLCVLKIYFWG